MCMIQLQIYVMICYESVLMNTMNYQMLEEIKWSPNMILKLYFLKDMILMYGQKMKIN